MADKPHHQIIFASRYGKSHFKTFRAYSALSRAEELVDDARSLGALKGECEKAKVAFGRRIETYEIVNYYAVGFVTCLEWHARSRLADLLIHDPTQIRNEDIDKVSKAALVQVMSANVTVPYLVGAAWAVSSVSDYLRIFERVFKALGIRDKLEKDLRAREVAYKFDNKGEKASLYNALSELFEARHELVHEVGMNVVAHFSLRDLWQVEHPAEVGAAVIACIRLVEKYITEKGPKNFPNRLDADGVPEDETEKLEAEITELEGRIEKHMAEFEEADRWRSAVEASKAALKAETAFMEDAVFLRPVRHLDTRAAVRDELLKLRLAYLNLLADEIDRDARPAPAKK